jgi:threonine synthase
MGTFAKEKKLVVDGPADNDFVAGRGDTEITLATISRYFNDYGYLLDPHTAVGVSVAEKFLCDGIPTICLATAHPAKFAATIEKALRPGLAVHPTLEALKSLPARKVLLEPEKSIIEDYVSTTIVSQ